MGIKQNPCSSRRFLLVLFVFYTQYLSNPEHYFIISFSFVSHISLQSPSRLRLHCSLWIHNWIICCGCYHDLFGRLSSVTCKSSSWISDSRIQIGRNQSQSWNMMLTTVVTVHECRVKIDFWGSHDISLTPWDRWFKSEYISPLKLKFSFECWI